MARGTVIGIEIGGTKLQLVAGDATAGITHRVRKSVLAAGGRRGICREIEAGLNELRASIGPIDAVGVGFGGPVDRLSGRVARSHQIDGWDNFPLRDWVAERSDGAGVVVENDANTAALGEAFAGAGVGVETVFYANFGSGVGGGLVARGEVYHGDPPGEMEFGHLRLDRTGATVESRCSGWAVDARVRELAAAGDPNDALAQLIRATPGGEARHLAAALAERDGLARRVINDVAGDIGFALSHVVHLVHPGVIVLGGGLSLIGEPFRAAVADALAPVLMEALASGPPVRLAALGEDAVPVGAMHLAMREASKQKQGLRT